MALGEDYLALEEDGCEGVAKHVAQLSAAMQALGGLPSDAGEGIAAATGHALDLLDSLKGLTAAAPDSGSDPIDVPPASKDAELARTPLDGDWSPPGAAGGLATGANLLTAAPRAGALDGAMTNGMAPALAGFPAPRTQDLFHSAASGSRRFPASLGGAVASLPETSRSTNEGPGLVNLAGLAERMQQEAGRQELAQQQLAAQQQAAGHLGAIAGAAQGAGLKVQIVGANAVQW